MNRHILRGVLSIAAVAAATVPFLFTPGCLSSPSTPSDGGSSSSSSSGSSNSSSSGSPSGDGGGTSSGGAACLPPEGGAVDTSCVIDDMSMPATETGGYWYTFSDRTIPNSTILVPGAAGIISPLEGAQFPPDTVSTTGPLIPGVTGPAPFREFSGSGLTLWGAGMGFDWKDLVPPTDPDAGDGAAALGVPISYDASAHKGISFWGISNTGKNQSVGVHFSDKREAAAAGLCDADAAYIVYDGGADTVNSPTECSDDFLKAVTFFPTWSNITVKFSATVQGFTDGDPLAALDPTSLYQVHFQVNNPGYAGKGPIAPEPAWDISVAYITWYDGP